jgi:hypothetical protein
MKNEPNQAAIGWSSFAASMLMLLGLFHVVAGIAAIANDERFVVTEDYVVKLDITQWGWIHLVLGVIVFLSGIGIYSGNVLARTVGVLVAGLGALSAFVYLPIQPIWSSILIAVAVAVIWALTAHGRDIVVEG